MYVLNPSISKIIWTQVSHFTKNFWDSWSPSTSGSHPGMIRIWRSLLQVPHVTKSLLGKKEVLIKKADRDPPKDVQCGSQPGHISWKSEIYFLNTFIIKSSQRTILVPCKQYKKDPVIPFFMIQSVCVQKWSTSLVHFSKHKFAVLNGWA